MNSQMQSKFDTANKKLEEGSILEFYNSLVELYGDMTCNCFLSKQEKSVYEKQLELIEQIEDNSSDFELNLVKGFVYLRNKKEKEGYLYLTNSINIDNSKDLPYSLRASIEPEINPDYEEDAKNAVLLNPSARNYFVLANCFDYTKESKDLEKSLIYFGKAVKLRPDFACAYNNRALRFEELKDYKNAIEDYKKCIDLEEDHWAYYQLWYCLDEEKRYLEALEYAKLGASYHSNNIRYQFCLGVANARLEKYDEAIKHYQNYLKERPESEVAKSNLEISKSKIIDKYLIEGKKHFDNRAYDDANVNFQKFLDNGKVLYGEDLEDYLVSMLKVKDKNLVIGEDNAIYKRLDNLKSSYNQKNENGEELLEEEENVSKLMQYQANYKIGFGNYEGMRLEEIIGKDAHYILWCIINLEHFSIENSLFLDARLKSEPEFLLALEHNLIKTQIIEKWEPEEEDYYPDDHYYDDYSDDMQGDWGGLYGEEAEVGYWNTE